MNFPVVDPDGDPLTYVLEEGPAGMAIDRHGRVTILPTRDDIGVHRVSMTASDAFGFVRLLYNLTVQDDTQAPQVQVTLSRNPVPVDNSVTIAITAVDDVRVDTVELFVDGRPVTLDARGQATDHTGRARLDPGGRPGH